MPLTPEEVEVQLEGLRGGQKKLERRLRSSRAFTENPLSLSTDLDDLGSVKTYLTIEKPGQVPGTPPTDVYYLYGYRTRRMPMNIIRMPDAAPSMSYVDAAIRRGEFSCRVPSDWVPGTDITVNMHLFQAATGGGPTAVLRSWVGVASAGEAYDRTNIEDNVNANMNLTQNILTLLSRTITGASLAATDGIYWRLDRNGSDGADTVNATMYAADTGIWIEYTAEF